MPTDDERRQIAARLRSLKFTFEDGLEDELSAFYDALECNPGQKRWETNPYWFLADLIEQEPICIVNITFTAEQQEELFQRVIEYVEINGKRYVPERTCQIEMIDTGNKAAYEHYEHIAHCHSCHHEFGYVLYNEDGDTWQDEKPNYCPNCGAKVVE